MIPMSSRRNMAQIRVNDTTDTTGRAVHTINAPVTNRDMYGKHGSGTAQIAGFEVNVVTFNCGASWWVTDPDQRHLVSG